LFLVLDRIELLTRGDSPVHLVGDSSDFVLLYVEGELVRAAQVVLADAASESDELGLEHVRLLVDAQAQVTSLALVLGIGLSNLLVILLERLDPEVGHVGAVLLLVLQGCELCPLGLQIIVVVHLGNPCI